MIATPPQPGVLHLVSAPSRQERCRAPIGRTLPAYLCAQALERGLTPRGRVVLIGDQPSAHAADAIGLSHDQRLAPPMGRIEMLSRTLRRIANGFERVICWDDELAPLLRGIHCPADLISTRPDLARRRVSSRVQVRVFERADRAVWESRNHLAEIDSVLNRLVADPAPAGSPPDRAQLGIDPDSICIGILADRPGDIDARSVGFLMGLLNASGYNLTAVLPNGASYLTDARRHHHGLGHHFRLIVAQSPIITMLPIFDVLIHPCYNGSGASSLIEQLCENLDTPVLRLNHAGRAGLSRAPGVAGPVIEALDDMLASRVPDPSRTSEAHAHA